MQIDRFIEALFEHQAEALILCSGEKPALRIGGKPRPLSSPAPDQKSLDAALAVLAPDVAEELLADGDHAVTYAAPRGSVLVQVKRLGELLRLEVIPAPQDPPGATDASAENGAAPVQNGAAPAENGVAPVENGAAPASRENGVATAAPQGAEAVDTSALLKPRGQVSSGPATREMDALFNEMIENGCSDLHLSTGMPPIFRRDGSLVMLSRTDPISAEQMVPLLYSITPRLRRDQFEQHMDSDFSYEIPGLARFRCNLFLDRNGAGGVFRQIPADILTAEQLNLSSHILDLCTLNKGLVVVTGPTGSGKSTTLAAMIDHINQTRADHIITIEDPVEFVHPNKKCLINQREVANHTEGFKPALRAALREDPDIVLVGEMRDLETVEIAIETAETGHLVFGTLHTNTAPSTVDRIIDQFPTDRQGQIRTMLSESLKGVIAQTLCKKKGGGRVAALEVLIVTAAVSNLIREGKTFQIPSAMQTGRKIGMQTLNDALLELVKSGAVEPAEAYAKAVAREEFRSLLGGAGIALDVAEGPVSE